MELILGMQPLSLFDAPATPMYDAFAGQPSNDAPYDAIAPKLNLLATNAANTAGARASSRLPMGTDRIPQAVMDRLLWQAVPRPRAEPPPPRPHAGPDRPTTPAA